MEYQELTAKQKDRVVEEFFPKKGVEYQLDAILRDLLLSYVTRTKAMEYAWLYESYKGDTYATNRLEEAYGVIVTEHVNRERESVTLIIKAMHFNR